MPTKLALIQNKLFSPDESYPLPVRENWIAARRVCLGGSLAWRRCQTETHWCQALAHLLPHSLLRPLQPSAGFATLNTQITSRLFLLEYTSRRADRLLKNYQVTFFVFMVFKNSQVSIIICSWTRQDDGSAKKRSNAELFFKITRFV